jgi:arylsulfatase
MVPGTIRHDPCHFVDIMATACDLAGASYPSEKAGHPIHPLEGESLVPALLGKPWNRERPIYWEHEGNRAVRVGDWKLVAPHLESWELYDLREDRTELRDLASADTRRRRDMEGLWTEWADRCGVLPAQWLFDILGPSYKAWLETGR